MSSRSPMLPPSLTEVHTPVEVQTWSELLQPHPDGRFRDYLVQGLSHGFHLGCDRSRAVLMSAKSNMHSATMNAHVVDEKLMAEVKAGRVIGPLDRTKLPEIHVSRFGVIPKNHQPGKWRMIVDLSHPKGHSVNDCIDSNLCSLQYTSVDEAVKLAAQMGTSCEMAKFDLENAYRIVPVHPDDRPLLGLEWKGELYIDTALPFGLRSAPKIFNALADGLHWILEAKGVCPAIHYLDDFMIFGQAQSDDCKNKLQKSLSLCTQLGIPVATHKTEGPATCITFLGIELDSAQGILRLPNVKLQRLRQEIAKWSASRSMTKRELLSLIGQLHHACCIVKPGRSFLRRMIELSTVAKELYHRVRLNRGFRSDLSWWANFLPSWNGVGMMSALTRTPPHDILTSDASGSWGCGAYTGKGHWFQFQWPEQWRGFHITVKELLPIVLGVAVWGDCWRGKLILCRCDNAAVVAIIRSGTSKHLVVMELIRTMFFILAHYNICLSAEHLPGHLNIAADALSRDNLAAFHAQVRQAAKEPTLIPDSLHQLLVAQRPDWTSPNWTLLWNSFFRRD